MEVPITSWHDREVRSPTLTSHATRWTMTHHVYTLKLAQKTNEKICTRGAKAYKSGWWCKRCLYTYKRLFLQTTDPTENTTDFKLNASHLIQYIIMCRALYVLYKVEGDDSYRVKCFTHQWCGYNLIVVELDSCDEGCTSYKSSRNPFWLMYYLYKTPWILNTRLYLYYTLVHGLQHGPR